MKLRSVLGTLVAFGAMALMAVGVQAATYSAGAVSPEAGIAEVPVIVTPDSSETSVSVNGYIMKLTYDPTKVTPKLADPDATGSDCYATPGTGFDGTNSVIVCDKVSTSANEEVLAVSWASATPVSVTEAATMALVDFTVDESATGTVPINVELVALTNDGNSDTASSATVASGEITIDAVKFLRGDANGNGEVTSADANLIIQSLIGKSTIAPENLEKANANADANGDITAADATIIIQSLLGKASIPD